MLIIKLTLDGKVPLTLTGELWNVSNLARISCYDFEFDDRKKVDPDVRLTEYPRWSESTRGLFARCLALTVPDVPQALPEGWHELRVEICINPGGRRRWSRPLAQASLMRNGRGLFNVGSLETDGEVDFVEDVIPRPAYPDAWALAEHALRVTTFAADALPPVKPLDIKVRKSGKLAYICTSDIPEPTRSIFEARMARSSRPAVAGHRDAVYAWDWEDFLDGAR